MDTINCYWSIFLASLKSIPDIVWSGLFAATLTLCGVFYSDWRNTRRLKLQLQHDSDEKTKERTATLRRDIYLKTVEELVKLNSYLSNLPSIDLPTKNLGDGFQNFSSVAAQLGLVAEPKTTLLVNELNGKYGELIFQLMEQLIPLSKAKTDITLADNFYNKSQEELARILSAMTRYNESVNTNFEIFEALQKSYDFHQSQSKKFARQRATAWKKFNSHNISYQKFLLVGLKDISLSQIPVLIEIRKDLGLEGDLSEIESQMKQQWSRMEAHLNSLIQAAIKELT